MSIDGYAWEWRFEADSITGLSDGAAIQTWPDSSGNGRDATQGTAARRPLWLASGFGGVGGVQFPSSYERVLKTGAISALSQPSTVFIVSTGISVASTVLIDGITSGNRHLLAKTSGNASYAFAGTVATTTNVNLGEAGVLAARFNGSSSKLWLNGDTDTVSVGTHTLTGLAIGNAGTVFVPAGGQVIGAVLVVNGTLSDADMDVVGNYLATKYGYTWTNLVAGGVTATLNATAPAPQVTLSADVTIPPVTATLNATAPAPVVSLSADVVAPVTATLNATAPLPSVTLTADVAAPAGDVTATLNATAPLPVVSLTADVAAPPALTDAVNLSAPTPVNVGVDLLPIPGDVPAGLTTWPITIESHPMPAFSEALPRIVEGQHYNQINADYGRMFVTCDGIDVTYLRDVPCEVLSFSSNEPSGDTAARISFPQIEPWDERGVGDLAPFRADAPVVIGIVRESDSSVNVLWEGYLASEGDATGEARESTVFDCEGTFWQAAHTMHIPPLHLEPTDVGVLVARALNAVPNRRYAAIPETLTGILTRNRGTSAQSVLAYVQDLLAQAWTDDQRQWTLVKVAPHTYRVQIKDVSTIHATFTKGAKGVEVDLQRDESTRVDVVYGRGIAPSGGVWANWFWPGLDLYTPPPYPYASAATTMSVGDTDAGTLTGTGVSDWQRRVVDLGYSLTVDGVFSSADREAALWVQRLRGVDDDGIVGPQTWNATWDVGAQALDLTAIRLPLAWKPEAQQFLYTANGAVAGENPDHDPGMIRHAHDLNFGADTTKTTAKELAQRYLDIHGEAVWTGRVNASTDPHEETSRLELRAGNNAVIVGHDGGASLTVHIADVEHTPLESRFLVDERARDAMTIDALLQRDRDARRDPNHRPGNPSKLAQLDRHQVIQFEDESKAGVIPRIAVNGNVGLWTVLPIFVAQTGHIAVVDITASNPATTFAVALFGRPITANQLASMVPNPLTSSDGWRDHDETLIERYGWIDTWGEPGQRGGYYPRQESEGAAVTGRMKDPAGAPFVSEIGGYLWAGFFSDVSTFMEGRIRVEYPL